MNHAAIAKSLCMSACIAGRRPTISETTSKPSASGGCPLVMIGPWIWAVRRSIVSRVAGSALGFGSFFGLVAPIIVPPSRGRGTIYVKLPSAACCVIIWWHGLDARTDCPTTIRLVRSNKMRFRI
jgi:hypothetical protein